MLLRSLFKNRTYKVRRGIAKGLYRKGGMGFVPQFVKETPERQFLPALDLRGKTVFDVGGLDGLFSIFFARAVGPDGAVYTFEPNPMNVMQIKQNIVANNFTDRVTVIPLAVGDSHGIQSLSFDPLLTGQGSILSKAMLRDDPSCRPESVDVMMDTIDNLISNGTVPSPGFIKIDTEGYEVQVLRGMQRTMQQFHPELFIETHPLYMRDDVDVDGYCACMCRLLNDENYCVYHVEDGRPLDGPGGMRLMNAHLYCKAG